MDGFLSLIGLGLVLGSVLGFIAFFVLLKVKRRVGALELALREQHERVMRMLTAGASGAVVGEKKEDEVVVDQVLSVDSEVVLPTLPVLPALPIRAAEVKKHEDLPLVGDSSDSSSEVGVEVIPVEGSQGQGREVVAKVETISEPDSSLFEWASVESFIGGKLFAWLGGLCLFICLGYFAKYSIENNLVSPEVRVGSIYVFGALLVGLGFYFVRSTSYRVLSEVLLSVGVLAFYIATLAGYSFYHFPCYTFEVSGVLLVLITGAAMGIAYAVSSRTMACLALLGGFVSPFMLELVSSPVAELSCYLMVYLFILNCGLLLLTAAKKWVFLIPLAILGSFVVFLSWILMGLPPAFGPFVMQGEWSLKVDRYLDLSLCFFAWMSVVYAGFSLWKREREEVGELIVLMPLWIIFVSMWVFFSMTVAAYMESYSLAHYFVLIPVSILLSVSVSMRTRWGILLYAACMYFINDVFHGVIWSKVGRCVGDEIFFEGYFVHFVFLLAVLLFALGLWLRSRTAKEYPADRYLSLYPHVAILGGLFMLRMTHLATSDMFSIMSACAFYLMVMVGMAVWACKCWRLSWLGLWTLLGVSFVIAGWSFSYSFDLSMSGRNLDLLAINISMLVVIFAPFFCAKSSENSSGLWISSALMLPVALSFLLEENAALGSLLPAEWVVLVVALPSLLGILYLWWKGKMTKENVSAYTVISILCTLVFCFLEFYGLELVLALIVESFVLVWVARLFNLRVIAAVAAFIACIGFINVLSVYYLKVEDFWGIPGANVYLLQLGLSALLLMASRWIIPQFKGVVTVLLFLGGASLFWLVNLEIANFFTLESSQCVQWSVGDNFAHSLSYSCAWGIFALCLLVLGFFKDNKVLRWVGLALFAVTLVKVLCLDTVHLRDLYRVISLFITAVITIVASIAYQKRLALLKRKSTGEK